MKDEPKTPGFLERLGRWAGMFAERFVPDPWIYAIALTFIAFFGAVIVTDKEVVDVARAWHKGLWNKAILVLIAQFSFNLIVCTSLARTPLVKGLLARMAGLPRSPRMAVWLIGLVSIGLSLISWALCIIGGAIFAQEVCREGKKRGMSVHYPLAIAAGYIGMMTFGLGLTSSAPLMVSSAGHLYEAKIGVIPFSETVGSLTSLGILAFVALLCPLILGAMHPSEGVVEGLLPLPLAEDPGDAKPGATFAERLEKSPLVLKLGALLPLSFFVDHFFIQGKGISIDAMNLAFLCAALLLFRTPRQMLRELARASQGVWSIVFQFPFYAGLMGIIVTTGLGKEVAAAFGALASEGTWPMIGVSFQALCNLFVPSAGGQWLVTGEILIDSSQAFHYSNGQAVLIEVMGDQLTNMIQPMWALPALALSGLEARHIMGYTAVVMMVAYAVMVLGLSLFPV